MTNPDNAVGTNAAYGGRTSVNAFNDDLSAYTRGVLSGWACTPDTGLTVKLGGDGNTRDVAIAEDSAGNKTTINNRVNSPISVTIGAAPAANTRIDAIVAYVDASPQGSATITDNYEACGLITVPGSASASPVAPSESTIRSAITADGASGSAAYYVVLAYVSIASGTTDITANQITAGENAVIQARNMNLDTQVYTTTTNQVPIENDGWYHIEWLFRTPSQSTAGGGRINATNVSGTSYVTRFRCNSDGTMNAETFTYTGSTTQVFITTDANTTGTGVAGWYVSLDLMKKDGLIRILGNWRGIDHISTGFTSSEFSSNSTVLSCARANGSVSAVNIKVQYTPLNLQSD